MNPKKRRRQLQCSACWSAPDIEFPAQPGGLLPDRAQSDSRRQAGWRRKEPGCVETGAVIANCPNQAAAAPFQTPLAARRPRMLREIRESFLRRTGGGDLPPPAGL